MTTPVIPSKQTASTAAFYTALRQYLVNYIGPNEDALSDILASDVNNNPRLYIVRAADDIGFPYGVMRLETTNAGDHHGLRLEGMLEIQLFGRPWTQGDDIEHAADLVEQAMYAFLFNSDGLAFCHGKQRQTLPPGIDPADSEVYTVRLVFTLAIWPAYLTRLTQS